MDRSGPFGLWMGMTLLELSKELGDATQDYEPTIGLPFVYEFMLVPNPHPAFDTYLLKITPKHGLSWIAARTEGIQTSIYGAELKVAFDSWEQKVSKIYGQGQRHDVLLPDSSWNEARDWMQSLLKNERFLFTVWSSETSARLRDSLRSVGLTVRALDELHGVISLEYSFENLECVEAEISAEQDGVL